MFPQCCTPFVLKAGGELPARLLPHRVGQLLSLWRNPALRLLAIPSIPVMWGWVVVLDDHPLMNPDWLPNFLPGWNPNFLPLRIPKTALGVNSGSSVVACLFYRDMGGILTLQTLQAITYKQVRVNQSGNKCNLTDKRVTVPPPSRAQIYVRAMKKPPCQRNERNTDNQHLQWHLTTGVTIKGWRARSADHMTLSVRKCWHYQR
uniref:Uncharacterized protein n=1 Tax=Timema bartmani TaxID=61472 RepID=A0A7R9F7R8_9NEOP|nr:unnamed protein product [Timema bartmani]